LVGEGLCELSGSLAAGGNYFLGGHLLRVWLERESEVKEGGRKKYFFGKCGSPKLVWGADV